MMKNFEHDFILPPFPGFPSASRFVPVGPVQETFTRVSRSIIAREAISLIIGPPGTGKSLVCSLLAKEFAASHEVIALGETSITDETSFYRFLLHRLGVALEPGKRDDLELQIHERLCGVEAKPNGTVLIIDEAASLSAEVLEVIRRMTNLMRDGQPMVSVVVAGGVKLDDTLTSPSMEPFVQRVTARCYLHPLNANEARQYIRESIQACDASPDETIADKAISAIFHATSGVPRLINHLMTEAIDCAAEMNDTLIDEKTIDRAWASLQQLPSPMIDEPQMMPECSDVEFGQLVDPAPINMQPIAEESVSLGELDLPPVEETISEAELMVEACLEESIECQADDSSVETHSDPVSLFGEFEDEEKIEVGAAQVRTAKSDPAELSLESMLHSQIVSLSQFVSENTALRYSDIDSLAVFKEPGSDEMVAETTDATTTETGNVAPSVVWYDEPEEAESDDADSTSGRDDTDLLWITEDIDVDRKVVNPGAALTPHRVDMPTPHEAPKLSVDYREMLEKMRNQA